MEILVNSRPMLFACGTLLLYALTLTAADAKTDADLLQGRWGAEIFIMDGDGENERDVPAESPIQWVFEGDKITFWNRIEVLRSTGTFKLDPTKSPKTIDLQFPE